MAGLKAGEVGDGAHDMSVFGHHHAVFNPVSQAAGGCLCHLPGGFAGGNQQYPARKFHAGQRTLHCRVRLDGRDGFADDPVRVTAQLLIHIYLRKNN